MDGVPQAAECRRIRKRRDGVVEPSMNRMRGTIAVIALQSRETLSGSRHRDVPIRGASFPSGSNLAPFKTDSYISARSVVPYAEGIMPITHHIRPKPMPKPQYCAQQEFLRHLACLAGVNAVTVWALGKNRYQLSVLIQGKTQEQFNELLLSTQSRRSRPTATKGGTYTNPRQNL